MKTIILATFITLASFPLNAADYSNIDLSECEEMTHQLFLDGAPINVIRNTRWLCVKEKLYETGIKPLEDPAPMLIWDLDKIYE